jgi:hypothetical protein
MEEVAMKMKSGGGGGYGSRPVSHSREGKQEPVSHKGNEAGVGQIGLQHAFKPEPMTQGKGYEPKGPTSNLGQGPGANRTIFRSGSQQPTPPAKPMEPTRDTLSEYGKDIPGRR